MVRQCTPSEAYAILGVEEGAPFDQVKSAYKKLALKTHPDKNPDNEEANEQFQAIGEAYSVLSKRLDPAQQSSRPHRSPFSGGYSDDDEDDYYYDNSEDDDDGFFGMDFYMFLFEELMNGRSGRSRFPGSGIRFPRVHRREEESAEAYQARIKSEREARAAALDKRKREEEARRIRRQEEKEQEMKDAAERRKAKIQEKKDEAAASRKQTENTLRQRQAHAQAVRSEMFAAAENGNEEKVKKMIWEGGVDASGGEHLKSPIKKTLLHVAVSQNSLGLVKWLDEHNAEAYERNADNLSPFNLAAQLGHVQIMRYFLEAYPPTQAESLPVLKGPSSSMSNLRLAMQSKQPEGIWLILESKLATEDDMTDQWRYFTSVKGRAAFGGQASELYQEVRELFVEHCPPSVIKEHPSGATPLPSKVNSQKPVPKIPVRNVSLPLSSSDVTSSPSGSSKSLGEAEGLATEFNGLRVDGHANSKSNSRPSNGAGRGRRGRGRGRGRGRVAQN